MLGWILTFLLLALVAGVLGFTTIAGSFAVIAKVLFFAFLVLLVLSIITGAARRPVQ